MVAIYGNDCAGHEQAWRVARAVSPCTEADGAFGRRGDQPLWTFGGGTVLMLRLGHRQSKDIDLFVPDPQYLGYLNPRLSDVAEEVSTDYEENAEFIKFYLPDGEIDIVVGAALTAQPFDVVPYAEREIKVETCAEIIAKKMWHRGNQAKGIVKPILERSIRALRSHPD